MTKTEVVMQAAEAAIGMDNIIVVKDFVKKYGDFTAVDRVSFEVEWKHLWLFRT